ncbi:MAG: asparagine synthase-related protein [Pirellulales bacterium]|nr:asparagine synthase-related protein [Pirellulales bacterium]
MTALAGAIWSPDDAPLSEAVGRAMHTAMKFRGGTDVTIHRTDVAFGHAYQPTPGALLSVSDGSQRQARQIPKVGENGPSSTWCIVDGRIDNAEAVRLRLEAAGFSPRSRDLAELVAHLYEEEGTDAFARLRGAFAIAVWDSDRRELTLARDPCGQRPMYYERRGGRMVFCSELRGLKPALAQSPQLNASALDEYLTYGYVPPPHTLLQGVSKVPPGTWVRLKDGRLDSGRFDSLDLQHELSGSRIDTQVPAEFFGDHTDKQGGKLIDLVRDALEESVPLAERYALFPYFTEGDRPWEILMMVRSIRQTGGGDDEDELGPDTKVRGVDFDWLDYFAQCDEPIGDVASASLFFAARKAAAASLPLLTSTGGHELLACHRRHKRLISMQDKIPGWLNKFMGSDSRSLEEQAAEVRGRQRKYLQEICLFGESDRANLYAAEHLQSLADVDPEDFLHLAFDRVSKRDPVSRAALVDWQTHVPNAQLAVADWAACRFDSEILHPFLDEDVARLLAATPGRAKSGLRDSIWPMRRIKSVDSESGPAFDVGDVPLASLDAVLNDERFHSRSYLDEGCAKMLNSYTSTGPINIRLHRQAFALAALEVWMRKMLD